MAHFIDRRPNPKDKNLGNRQRFMRRARGQIKEVVSRSVRERKITDAGPAAIPRTRAAARTTSNSP